MPRRFFFIILIAAGLLVGCETKNNIPADAWRTLVNQINTPNLKLENAQQGSKPRELFAEASDVWCVVTSVNIEGAPPLYGNYLVYRTNAWQSTIADSQEDFLAVGCANFRAR